MTLKAKPILKNKFWIVENEGNRIGTMSLSDDRYMFSSNIETCFFDNKRQMKKKFGYDIVWDVEEDVKNNVISNVSLEVHGFATSVVPYNALYDVKRKLPLFTKSEKSKSLYCAGYYIIKFDKGWVKSFCPKLITVERYETRGPFKSDLEMRQELSIANR
tara:strand:+ start:2885 stop:3364 length:480 start_codon:yes stop_codon:yes gene_type:complete